MITQALENFDINKLNTVKVGNGIEMKEWPEVYFTAHLPTLEEGMSVTTYMSNDGIRKAIGFFRVIDLIVLHLNIARKKGTIQDHVNALSRQLSNHQYIPFSVESPVITVDADLVTGKNRFGAHDSDRAKKSQFIDENGDVWMWCTMCDFPLKEDGSVDLKSEALYHYAFNENTRSWPNIPNEDEDLIFYVSNAFSNGVIPKPTAYYVTKFVKKLNYPTPNNSLMDRILQEIDEDYHPVEIPSDDRIKREVKIVYNKNVTKNGKFQIRSFRATESDAAMERYFRFLYHAIPLLSAGTNMTVYSKITNSKAKGIVSGRNNVEKRLEIMIGMMRKLVKAYDEGTIGKLVFKWVSQNKDETSKGFWL